MSLYNYYPSLYLYVLILCVAFIRSLHSDIHISLLYDFKNKHFWPYIKYNNTCLNYEKPGWPRVSSPM